MGNLMTSLYTGVSGLKVNQSGLNVTGHNLANVDTAGYVRQQVLAKDFSYNSIGQNHLSSMQIGIGTDMAVIRQVRDVFLDKAYRLEVGRQGFYETQYEAVGEVESLFGELQGETFQQVLEDFWTSLQELAKEPDDIVKKTSFIDTASSFMERAEKISSQLSEYQVNLNTQINAKVTRINEIGDAISELNYKIRSYESGDEAANDYRDKRNNLLDELGKLAKFTYKENNDGMVSVNLEGGQFVTDDRVFHLTTTTVNDSTAMLKPVWELTGQDLYTLDRAYSSDNDTDIGTLKGLLIARGGEKANYTDIPLRENYTTVEAYDQAVWNYNNTVNTSVLMTVQAQFDQMMHGIVTTINDILSPNTSVDTYADNMKLSSPVDQISYTKPDGTVVTLSGTDLDKVKLWDEAKAPVGSDENATAREALFNRKSTERYTEAEMTLDDGTSVKVYIYNEENPDDIYSMFTLGQIEINKEIKNNYSKLPLESNSYSGKSGAYDIDTCNKLTEAWNIKFAKLDPNTLTKSTFKEYYTSFMGSIANKGKVFEGKVTHQESTVETLDNQRQQTSGVSSDEELTNLIKFQHGYNAAARYITVIDQMIEHLVTRL